MAVRSFAALAILLLLAALTAVHSIGVNYGTLGNNLPPPAQVAQFVKEKTTIDRVKIFDANPEILRAFANTGILVAITVPNHLIVQLTNLEAAKNWVSVNIKPFYPQTKINYILLGNEILHWGPQEAINNLVAAMKKVHEVLQQEGLKDIKVSTSHSLGMLIPTDFPSQAEFQPQWRETILKPMLQFHRETKSPFIVNPYPYFGYNEGNANMCLFKQNNGLFDKVTRKRYDNMFDKLMDSVFIAMMKLGYKDVEIAVGETGWASQGETWEQPKCSITNAASYNGGLVKKYKKGKGTPLMRRKKFEIYIFALFNENQKSGSLAEHNFGLFYPNFTPVYDVGITRAGAVAAPVPIKNVSSPAMLAPMNPSQGKTWCMAKASATEAQLVQNIEYACSQGISCQPIQPGGACYTPNDKRALASFAMNRYYRAKGPTTVNCDFAGTGEVTYTKPPTNGACEYN